MEHINNIGSLLEEIVESVNWCNDKGINISPQFRRGQNHLLHKILVLTGRFEQKEEIDLEDSSKVKFLYK
jgi:hypothetical protein